MPTRIRADGVRYWGGGIDAEGHRTYKLKVQVEAGYGDGPAAVLNTPGLPQPGSIWLYENVTDPWAWCDGSAEVAGRQGDGQRETIWDLTYTYSTRPRGQRPGQGQGGGKDDRGQGKKCADNSIQNPLSEPPRTSGGSVRYQEEARVDKDGRPLRNTAFEPIKGPQATFDKSRGQVVVEQNVLNLELQTCKKMMDSVNDATLWDLPARCWKLSEFHWERKLYGTCYFYYTRRFVFESSVYVVPAGGLSVVYLSGFGENLAAGSVVSGWDRIIVDEASRVLNGEWKDNAGGGKKWVVANFRDGTVPDYTKQNHYVDLRNPTGAGNTRMFLSRTVRGTPATDATDLNLIMLKKYSESNFLLLGIPTSL